MRYTYRQIISLLLLLPFLLSCSAQQKGQDNATPAPTPTIAVQLTYNDIQQSMLQLYSDAGYPKESEYPAEGIMADEELMKHLHEHTDSIKGARVVNWQGWFSHYMPIKDPPFTMNGYIVAIEMDKPGTTKEQWTDLYIYFEEPDAQQVQEFAQFQSLSEKW